MFCTRSIKPTTFIQQLAKYKHTNDDPSFTNSLAPRDALAQPDVASLFHHYISAIASWYDLGDPSRHFTTAVPALALDEPLLFSGVVAVAAMHVGRTSGRKAAMAIASGYHGECVGRLIGLDERSGLLENGVALATVCLLRTYEILDEDVDPNRHLHGAYSLASRQGPLNHLSNSLLNAGFWNYLREDITFSLFEGCPLKMDLSGVGPPATGEVGRLYDLSLILGRIINVTFTRAVTDEEWDALTDATKAWYKRLPTIQRPYARKEAMAGDLPSVWCIEDSHASAMHYFLTACCILAVFASPAKLSSLPPAHHGGESWKECREDALEAYATEICAIAFTTQTPSVLVNAFGPISYCAKYIRNESVRQGVVGSLTGCRRVIGWPVARLMDDLKATWAAS